jgi:hypothetical protein
VERQKLRSFLWFVIGGSISLSILYLLNGDLGYLLLGFLALIALFWNALLFPGSKKWLKINIALGWIVFVLASIFILVTDESGWGMLVVLWALGLVIVHTIAVYLLHLASKRKTLFKVIVMAVLILPILPALPDAIEGQKVGCYYTGRTDRFYSTWCEPPVCIILNSCWSASKRKDPGIYTIIVPDSTEQEAAVDTKGYENDR